MIKKLVGLSIIELVIVLCILGILCAIAYPSYILYLIRAHRGDGKTALIELATQMEYYYISNNAYPREINSILSSDISPGGWYVLSLTATPSSYTLTATPTKSQVNDVACGTLSLNNLGLKDRSGTATLETCW